MNAPTKIQVPASRLSRISVYLLEMFPPLVSIPAALMNFGVVYFAVQALQELSPLRLTWRGAAGGFTTVLFFLVLRVYDELKDVETDLRLGRAGDPRYKDRAIVTGRIQLDDLKALRWFVTILLFVVNLPLGFPMPFLAFAATFVVTWLSFHWFFWPAVSKSLLLAFVTHNPMALVVGAYAAAVAGRDFGSITEKGFVFVLLVGIWTSLAAWETSRKVRTPADETAYTTYSKILGWRTAGLAPLFFVLISATCFFSVAFRLAVPWIYPMILLLAVTVVAGACVRFELWPSTHSSNLRPYTEMYGLVAVGGFLASLLYHFSFTSN